MRENGVPRPPGVTKRDLLVGILAASAVTAGIHPALDTAAKACEPLFEDYTPDPRRWYPIITPTHARAAIAYAGRAYKLGAITREEHDWVCTKARMAIMKPPRAESQVAMLRPLTHPRAHLLLRDGGDDGPPEAA
jgi:hypothetical protein